MHYRALMSLLKKLAVASAATVVLGLIAKKMSSPSKAAKSAPNGETKAKSKTASKTRKRSSAKTPETAKRA